MKYLKFAYFLVLSIFLISCKNDIKQTFEKYPQISTVYTDNLQKTEKALDSTFKIYPLPHNLYQILPNQAILLWNTTINSDLSYNFVKITDKRFTLYLFSSSNLTINSFLNYLSHRNPELKYIVTDKPKVFKQLKKNIVVIRFKINDTNAYKAEFNKTRLIFAFQDLPESWPALKRLQNYKIENFKIFINPYSTACDFVQFIDSLHRQINFKQIFTNNLLTLKTITNKKFHYNNLTDRNLDHKLIYQIESGEKIFVYLKKPTFTLNNIKIKQLRHFFKGQNIYEDEFSLIIFSKYLTDPKFVKTTRSFAKKFKFQIIYSNKSKVLQHILDTSKVKIVQFDKLTGKIKSLKYTLDKIPCGYIYFISTTDTNGLLNLLNLYLKLYTKFNLSDKGYLYISPYLYDSTLDRKVENLYRQYKFDYIYTTKVPTIKFYLSGDTSASKAKILWFPYYLSQFNKKVNTNFVSKLQNVKIKLFSGEALVVYFNDPVDTIFLPYKKIKQLLEGPLIKKFETNTGIIFYSSFLDTNNIKTFKKIIGTDTSKHIFTNNVLFLRNILNYPEDKVSWLPKKCILPTCAINTGLQKKLSDIRIKIILDSALIIYFRDPTDSVFPDERELKEAFKFLNFVDFKKGIIIKSYEGH